MKALLVEDPIIEVVDEHPYDVVLPEILRAAVKIYVDLQAELEQRGVLLSENLSRGALLSGETPQDLLLRSLDIQVARG